MREYFYQLADRLTALLGSTEVLLLSLAAEQGDFVRLNRARVRQAGQVRQLRMTLCLIRDGRQALAELDLSEVADVDFAAARRQLAGLREYCQALPADPYLAYAEQVVNSESIDEPALPPSARILGQILKEARDLDLVGVLAAGDQYRGFANSLGQRNWHARRTFNFDFSCYTADDRAVKSSLAGREWNPALWRERLPSLRAQVERLRRPRKPLQPGTYRAYLAPAALAELLDLLAWGGFSYKALRTAQSPLLKLAEKQRHLQPAVELLEDRGASLAPRFSDRGDALPARVGLIRHGEHAGSLVDARSAREYAVELNSASEAPGALVMGAGDLAEADILTALDTGLYINNLWYCNFSDRNECRMTGMTRFATFWVENGRLQAPAEVMRFDDSLYRMLGEALLGISQTRELLVDPGSYGGRNLRASLLPGILLDGLRFAL